jgi:hypothetical protein
MLENKPKKIPLYYKATIPTDLLEEAMHKALPEPLPADQALRITDVRCDHRGGLPVVTVFARLWSKTVDGPHG